MALANSSGRVVRRGDYQGLDLGDEREPGADVLTMAVRTESEKVNH